MAVEPCILGASRSAPNWLCPESNELTRAQLGGLLDPHGPIAAAQRTLLLNATVVMLAVVVPVILMALGFAWWFRRGNASAQRRPGFTYSGQVEFTIWSIPLLVVMFLGGLAWLSSHDLDPARPIDAAVAPYEVQVVALDWKWLFLYPATGTASVNRMVVPAGVPVRLRLSSASVMNSFLVPQLAGQIYAMAGMVSTLHLKADAPGRYPGLSAQFSGDGFSDMRFEVTALAPSDFGAWQAQARAAGPVLDAAAYAELARPGTAVPVPEFRATAPGLFEHAIAQTRVAAASAAAP